MADDNRDLSDKLRQAVSLLAEELTRAGAGYALIGGIAAGVRGRARYTDDVDFLVSVPQLQLPGLLQNLSDRGFQIDIVPTIREWTQHHMVVMSFEDVRVDWLKPVLPLYQHVVEHAEVEQWHGSALRIARAEGLIILKLIASRTQDRADIEMLLSANRGQLELSWIEQEWCTIFDTSDERWQWFEKTVKEYYER